MNPGATTSPAASIVRLASGTRVTGSDEAQHAVADRDAPAAGRCAGPVDDPPAGDEEVRDLAHAAAARRGSAPAPRPHGPAHDACGR